MILPVRPFTIAIGNYGVTRPLKDGSIACGHLKLEHVAVDSPVAGMRRMVRDLEFDICEMAFTTYLCAKAYGRPITAIPVFITRNFHHWASFYNVKSGIKEPKDLEHRVVGVNRGYTVTTGTWARGILESEYGVDLRKILWAPTNDEHVAEFRAPANVDYRFQGKTMAELFASGEIEAAVGDIKINSPGIKPLIPNATEAGFKYFRKTGIYPINHTVVIANAVLEADPGAAEELFLAFRAAKCVYLGRLRAGTELAAADHAAIEVSRVVGDDPFPFGVEANRKPVEALVRFAVDQHIIPEPYVPEDLFAPGTLELE
jgi:4,5-dihydroxyphthalate decarboxylase